MALPERELGYADAAQVYWEKGWRGVLPLTRATKWPPPQGFTGYKGTDPSYADILQWSELYPDGNVCLRLPDGIVGIDVDAYGAKSGAKAFAEAVRRWGPLPDGPQSSSRGEDDLISGIRLFRVPPGTLLETIIVFPELSVGDIEVIQRHHRYVAAWPSVHPEGRGYWWRNSAGQLLGVPFLDDEIPDLPQPWLDALKMTPRSLEFTGKGYDTRLALTAGEPSPVVAARTAQAIKELNLPGQSRHDTCMRHVLAILRFGAEKHPGVDQALTTLREVFVAVTAVDNSRTRETAIAEFNRMVTNDNAARELSQPGILDWFKNVMDGIREPAEDDPDVRDANANRADDAGVAVPSTDTAAASEPPDPSSGGELELLEQDFWTARPQHELIFTAALNRMASPWAVLSCCVARVLALVPPRIVLPALIGNIGSLNWFAVIAAKSGGGKGAAMAVAKELVGGAVNVRPIGSGEGMIECYNRAPGKGDDPPPPVESVMFSIDEIDSLGAMNKRSGQTTMSILRQGFSGESLGYSYRGRQNEVVSSHTYRMTLIASVQPSRAETLLKDGGGGTPQRFMWFPGRDRRISADVPDWPVDRVGLPMALSRAATWQLENAVGVVDIPDEVAREIREARAASMNGDDNALDGHALFCREKLAYALAYLDGRVEIDSEDWRLAGIATAVSDWTRTKAIEAYREAEEEESRDRGQLKGVEHAAAELGKMQESVDRPTRVTNKVRDRIKRSMPDGISNRELTRGITGQNQGLVRGATDYLESKGEIMKLDGTTIWVMR